MVRRCATDRSRTDFECPRSWPSGIPPRRGRSSRAGPVDTGVEPAAAAGGGGRRGRHNRLPPQPRWRHSWGRGMPDSHPARSPVLPMRGGIPRSDGAFMRALIRIACLALLASGLGAAPAAAQATPQPADSRFSPHELVDTGHKFFGGVSRGLAQIIERAVSQWGLPNGYVLGQEAGGAFIGGLRYGEGTLYTKNAGDLPVFWQGPSLGWDFGGDGARTMMLVPIRSGVGLRLGANVGYVKFTPQPTWNPF